MAERGQRSRPGVRAPGEESNNVSTTERKSNEEKLTKMWESVQKKSPTVARKWSNIFDFKSSREAAVSESAVAKSDNIFAMSKERETSSNKLISKELTKSSTQQAIITLGTEMRA